MKSFLKIIACLSIIPLLTGLFFFSNIKGYYRFKNYCETEGGLRVYEKLERNVGWLADSKQAAMAASQLEYVAFVRYIDVEGKAIDVRYNGGARMDERSYDFKISNQEVIPVYHWISKIGDLQNENRLRLYSEEIHHIRNEKLLVGYYVYAYEVFNRSNTLLDMPSEKMCHVGLPGSAITEGSLSIQKIKTSFKD